MQDLFYCTEHSVSLRELIEYLRAETPGASARLATNHRANFQHDGVWFNLYQVEPVTDFGEEEQQELLRSLAIRRVIQFSFREALLQEVKPYLRLCLQKYGGWVGIDDGTFAEKFEVANLDQIDLALRAFADVPESETLFDR